MHSSLINILSESPCNQPYYIEAQHRFLFDQDILMAWKKNYIFFLNQFNNDDEQCFTCKSGIFNLEDGRIQRCFPSIDNSIHCRTTWLSPNIR